MGFKGYKALNKWRETREKSLLAYAKELIASEGLKREITELLAASPSYAEEELKQEEQELEETVEMLCSFREVREKVPVLLSKWYKRSHTALRPQ